MKKSVLFVSYSMGIGGVEKALLGTIDKFVKDGWEVHLALIKTKGEFLNYLPKNVEVTEIQDFKAVKSLIHTPMRLTCIQLLKAGCPLLAARMAYYLLRYKIEKGAAALYQYAFSKIPPFSERIFDLAVAYAGPDAFIDSYVAHKVRAHEKWGWIHFDISQFGIDRSIIKKSYRQFSRINIVSREGKEKFDGAFPQFASKTVHTPNIIDRDLILQMAEEPVCLPHTAGKKIILTVGRISAEKGQYDAILAFESLIKKGIDNLEWWFVGNGSDYERCKQYVIDHDLSRYIRFLGATPNPYPYMRACNLYVQPSHHEGFCITLAEAKLFGMSIIATDFTGAREQLANYSSPSLIVHHDPSAIADAIAALSK